MAPATGAAQQKGVNLTRKVCIVTGAASGFGAAVSRMLAARGAIVVLADRDRVKGEAVAADLDAQYSGELDIGFFPFVETDLSTFAGVKKVFDECMKRFGTVDIVINNAGIGDGDKFHFDEKDPESTGWQTMLNVNCGAVIYGTQLAINEFRESKKRGLVINTASGAAYFDQPHIPIYAGSKALVWQYTTSIGKLYPEIRVHSVCPGFVDTPLANASISGPNHEKYVDPNWVRRSAETLKPEDIGDAMMFIIDTPDMEAGASVQAFPQGLEVILPSRPRTVRKVKDVRKKEAGSKL